MRVVWLVALFVLMLGTPASAADDLATLVDRLKSNDVKDWTAAYTELQRRKDPAVIPLLLAAAPSLRSVAPQNYTVWILNALPDSKQARDALWALTRMKAPYLRARAAQALHNKGASGIGKVTLDIIAKLKADPSAGTTAIGGLYGVKDPDTRGGMLAWLTEKPAPAIYAKLIGYFDSLKDRDEAPDVLAKHLDDEHPVVRGLAAGYLFAYGDPSQRATYAGVTAKALATGEVPYTQFLTLDSILTLGPALPKNLLEALAGQVEVQEGYYVVRLLGLLKHGRYPGLVAIARRLMEDSHAGVSSTAFDILAAAPGGFTREALARHLESDDDAQRLQAARSLMRADDASGMPIVIEILAKGSVTHRRTAARAAGRFLADDMVDAVLVAMGDDDSLVRSYASASLLVLWRRMFPYRRLEFGSVGWSHSASLDVRQQALKALKAWWTAHKTARW